MNLNILSQITDESLVIIKQEAENNLSGIHKIEDVVTNKINNLVNICISFFIIISGYLLTSFSNNDYGILFVLSIVTLILLAYSVFNLHGAILPKVTTIVGAKPDSLVNDKFIKNDKDDKFRLLSNRVYCLQIAINTAHKSCVERTSIFKQTSKTLFVGLISIVSIGIVLFTLRSFLCMYLCPL